MGPYRKSRRNLPTPSLSVPRFESEWRDGNYPLPPSKFLSARPDPPRGHRGKSVGTIAKFFSWRDGGFFQKWQNVRPSVDNLTSAGITIAGTLW